MRDLDGKVAVVLGASAEGGTGWVVAEALASAGAKVVVAARSKSGLDRLAARTGGIAVVCDAARETDIKALAGVIKARHGKLDIAVNCAGLPVVSLVAEITESLLQDAMRVNFFGQVFFVKYMAEVIGQNGSIIFISSMAATNAVLPHFAYACAKSASDCLTRYAALEYGARNIRVNSILPGMIRTNLIKAVLEAPGLEGIYRKEVPLGRICEPRDIADAVIWLAGPAFVTGLGIQVNGGNFLTRCPRPDEVGGAETYDSIGRPGSR